MKAWISEYLESKKNAWSESTLSSERSRLEAVESSIAHGPDVLWNDLVRYKPYSRVTTFTRVSDFYDYLLEQGHCQGQNPFRIWRKRNARLFKGAYRPRKPDVSYDEAKALLGRIEERDVRQKCEELLNGGLRFTESLNREGEFVVGKGGKRRRAYAGASDYQRSYSTLLRRLRQLGLTPHQLRKIRATHLAANKDLSVFDLCEIFGWSDPRTAMAYVKANDTKIESIMKEDK
jgi:integrase